MLHRGLQEDALSLSIVNCSVINNRGKLKAHGAIYVQGSFEVIGSTFMNNSAGSEGGGIYAYGTNDSQFVIINQSNFINNSVERSQGGALTISGAYVSVSVEMSSFIGNSARHRGGAVNVFISNGSVSISDSTFTNNSGRGAGGAVYVAVSGFFNTVSLVRNVFINNLARDRGGAALIWMTRQAYNGSIVVSECTFIDNVGSHFPESGGALFMYAHTVSAYMKSCLLYTSPSPRDATLSRMPSSA